MYDESGNKFHDAREHLLQGIGGGDPLPNFVKKRYLEMLLLLNLGIHALA